MTESFAPDELRKLLGHYPTGVTVITADDGETMFGMAANSVTSVSLEPPLMLICPAKKSSTWPSIRSCGRFCINVMASDHEPLTRRFAAKDLDRFSEVLTHQRRCGPGLADAVAWLDCEITAEHDAGDHTIVIAEILSADAHQDRLPLVFYRGQYGTFVAADSHVAAIDGS
jgi:3-hydroxy-9,10-secoandrosta-1,3,5(10)-triene-9,17-dione monooxygenase reductase component